MAGSLKLDKSVQTVSLNDENDVRACWFVLHIIWSSGFWFRFRWLELAPICLFLLKLLSRGRKWLGAWPMQVQMASSSWSGADRLKFLLRLVVAVQVLVASSALGVAWMCKLLGRDENEWLVWEKMVAEGSYRERSRCIEDAGYRRAGYWLKMLVRDSKWLKMVVIGESIRLKTPGSSGSFCSNV